LSAAVVDSLQSIADAFEAVDADLAGALNKAKA
jgi:hypothetical protein